MDRLAFRSIRSEMSMYLAHYQFYGQSPVGLLVSQEVRTQGCPQV